MLFCGVLRQVLGVTIDKASSTVYVQAKIPFELLLRDWCFPAGSSEKASAESGWVFLLPMAAIVTEGISFAEEEEIAEQNICVRFQAMDAD